MKARLASVILMATLAMLGGCSGGKEAARTGKDMQRTPAEELAHAQALQHFVDGSLYEMKGEYAQAALEYQDALRYEKDPAVYFAIAKCYSQLGKHAPAIEAGKEAVRLSPETGDYRRMLAEIYLNAYELDSAAVQYEELLKQDSSSIDIYYNLARMYQSRKPLKALEIYEKIEARFGPQWEVLLQMADMYTALEKFEKAAEALQEMVSLDPGNDELKRSLAQAYVRAKRYDEAYAILAYLRERDPENADYLGDLAAVYLLQKEYTKATAVFDTLLAHDSLSVDAKLRIGEMYFAQLEKDSTLVPMALSVFERIRDKHPDDWRSYWFLGAIGAVAHIDSIALPNLKKVTELASWNGDGWIYLASVLMDKNAFDEVATLLGSALKVLPDDFRVNFYLGVAYSRLNRNTDAVRVLERAHELNSKDMNAISQLALVYDNMKNHEESDKLYEEALKIDAQNPTLLNNYSYSLADRGLQLKRALEMARKAVDAQPENASFLDTIGWVYYQLGDYKQAETYIKRAIGKGETNAVLFEHLGDVYFKMNHKDKALEEWNRALQLDKDNSALRDKVARGTL